MVLNWRIIPGMKPNRKLMLVIGALGAILILTLGLFFGKAVLAYLRTWVEGRNKAVIDYIRHPEEHRDWEKTALSRCSNAPFVLPTSGFIGYFYGDSFSPFKLHTGLDIFGGNPVGQTPIYAPYDGFLTREQDWKSSIIIRIPQDPLDPSRQIWVYMTHMADVNGNPLIDPAFPAGTRDKPVKQGDLIGYQGNFSGYPGAPTGIHLHVSIVKDDGKGGYLNELDIKNTLDPSDYFGMRLNAATVGALKGSPVCAP